MTSGRDGGRAGDTVGPSPLLVWNGVVTRVRRIGLELPPPDGTAAESPSSFGPLVKEGVAEVTVPAREATSHTSDRPE